MDLQKAFRAFLVNVYKKPESEIDALLNASDSTEEQAIATLNDWDKTRVAPFINKFQEGKNAGKAEALTALETDLKKAYNSQSELKGLDLINEIVSTQAAAGKGQTAQTLTEDDIKKLPAFQPIQREFNKQLKETKDNGEKAVNDLKTGYEKEQTLSQVGKQALEYRNGLKPVIPENPNIAANIESSFLSAFKEYDWQKQGEVWVPMKDGKVVLDGHGNALTLEGIAKAKAGDWYAFAANNGGSNAGNGKPGEGGTNSGGTVQAPKTFEEYSKIVSDKNIPLEQRTKVADAWEASQKSVPV